jgi:ABC-type nitrate/sulfonate/bicarbonate transport system ATPase subunit
VNADLEDPETLGANDISNRDHSKNSAAEHDALILQDVRFTFADGTRVLDGISASIASGSIVGIVGPSGCGKSTLLYLISQLLRPTSGHVKHHIVDPARHPLSMVFQKDTLLPWLTAADNVRFFTRFRKHRIPGRLRRAAGRLGIGTGLGRSEEVDARVTSLLRLAHLEENAKSYPYQMSGGMNRRVVFLAGVAPRPEILLLDEPFSAVDEPTRISIHDDVYKIIRMERMTTILVTHDLGEAITFCDRILMLSNRPARIVGEYAIPFGAQRDMLHIRTRPEFLNLYGRLWDDLSEQIRARSTDRPT